MNYLIILAGGIGKRFGHSRPKQFFSINGMTIFEHSIKNFEASKFERVSVVVDKEHFKECEVILVKYGFKNIIWAQQGKERQDSINSGALALRDFISDNDSIILQESVRPFVTREMISEILLKKNEIVVVPCVKPFVLHASIENNFSLIKKDHLLELQLPRLYNAKILLDIISNYSKDSEVILDELELFLDSGYSPTLIEGDRNNVKVTILNDIENFNIS